MNKPNLFWPVYKNLEKEIIKLADTIHFSDDQLNVYSIHIADLLVRCSIEIEAIAKELYFIAGGEITPTDKLNNHRDLYFDTDCMELLESKWRLNKKEIIVSALNFYFSDSQNIILTPLHKANKRGTSGSKWKQAYQSLKHDRKNSLNKATIGNLIQAIGALYILNLYYKSEVVKLKTSTDFDNHINSDIFSVLNYEALSIHLRDNNYTYHTQNNSFEKAIYITKYTNISFANKCRAYFLDEKASNDNFLKSTIILDFLNKHPEYKTKSGYDICMAAGGKTLFKSFATNYNSIQVKSEFEAIINKHEPFYPNMNSLEECKKYISAYQ